MLRKQLQIGFVWACKFIVYSVELKQNVKEHFVCRNDKNQLSTLIRIGIVKRLKTLTSVQFNGQVE
jgi:hypothetical protein